jgi:tripartite-type tricarboxylate transporter receptor subunit TctC
MPTKSSRRAFSHLLVRGACGVFAAGVLPHLAQAQSADSYPAKGIKIIVPFPPGGLNDVVARAIGLRLTDRWKQPVIAENRPGGGTIIGTDAVAKAAPDGYTLLLTSLAHAINPTFFKELPYDPVKSFSPITLVGTSPFILVVRPDLPVKNLKEFIALAKAKPGLTYGSTGNGGSSHLMGEMLKSMAKIDIVHVPYKGMTPAVTDLIGGQIDFTFGSYSSVGQHIKSGRIKPIAVSSAKRLGLMPELPAIAEAGYPDYDANPWWGLVAPAGTPAPIIAALNAEVVRILKMPEVAGPMREEGIDLAASTPAEYATHFEREVKRWGAIVRASGAAENPTLHKVAQFAAKRREPARFKARGHKLARCKAKHRQPVPRGTRHRRPAPPRSPASASST